MASTRADRRLMFFIAFAILVACLVAIAALVLAAILISMVRSGNAPRTASKVDTKVQGKRPKSLTSKSSYQTSKSTAYDLLCSKILLVSLPKFC